MTQTRKFIDPAKLPVVYHPGEFLKEKLLEMNMGVKEFATRVSKPEKTIIAVLGGKSSITPDMALSFELATRIPAGMWLQYQKKYDEFVARKRRQSAFEEGLKWANKFPFEEIANLGWLDNFKKLGGQTKDKVEILCSFFGVGSPKGWEDFYLNQKLQVSFRISLAEYCDPYALSAWLRQGEIQAQSVELNNKYSSKGLRRTLNNILNTKSIPTLNRDQYFIDKLKEVGVKLIFTPTLTNAPVKGCTRYLYGIPCIQMSTDFVDEYDFYNTLFHEIGHILLHGKKDIFIENVNYGDKDPKKEKEADEFAAEYLGKINLKD